MHEYILAVYYYQVQGTFYNYLGKLQIERGEYEKARSFQKALKSRPLDEEYKTNCGKALLLTGNEDNVENAEKLFFEILQQNEENSRANYYQGSVMMKKGDYDAALLCFSKCLRLNHHRPVEVNLKKGLVLLVREQFDDALECFQVARRLDPNNVCALNYIGCIHNLRGEEKKALRYHNRCLELDPNYVITCNRGQTLSCLRSVSGQEDLEEMVIWFQNQNLQLSEKQALQYSFLLYQNGLKSVNILNTCRRTKLLNDQDYYLMDLPEGIIGFLLHSPMGIVGDHSQVDQRRDWLRKALGVKCPILLQKIDDVLRSPKLEYTLPLLRQNLSLTPKKLQGELLGKYVTHAIIQYLKYEKWNKLTTQLLPKISASQLQVQGISDAELKQVLFGLFLQLDEQWVNLLFYATQHPQLIEIIKDKVSRFMNIFGNGAPGSQIEDLFWQLLDKKLNTHTETLQSTLEEFLCYLKFYLDPTSTTSQTAL